jgi:hypothetical protein
VTPSHTIYITTTDQRVGSIDSSAPGLNEDNSYWFYKGVVYALDLRTGALRVPAGTAVPVAGLQAEALGADLQNPEIESLTYWPSAPGFPGQLHIIVALQELGEVDLGVATVDVGGRDNYTMLHLSSKDESVRIGTGLGGVGVVVDVPVPL